MNVKQQARELANTFREGHLEVGHDYDASCYHEDKLEGHMMGLAGEICFARKYGLDVDTTVRPGGDGGVDFTVEVNGEKVTIDIKTFLKPCNLLLNEDNFHQCADIIVLAKYSDFGYDCKVDFLGWETKGIMRVMPKREFSSLGLVNHYRHTSLLRPMWKLEKIIVSEFM